MSRREFTQEEVNLIKHCVGKGMTALQASYHFENRRPEILRAKAVSMGMNFAVRKKRPLNPPPLKHSLPTVQPRSTESFTAFFFGDPAPGRSALDQKRGAA